MWGIVGMNYRLVAIQIGDLLKYSTSVNEINRIAGAIFRFQCERFPNEAISSVRAQLIHDWILSLARQEMTADERGQLLVRFCNSLASEEQHGEVNKILMRAGFALEACSRQDYALFQARGFHPEVNKHCRELFVQGDYSHAVFEACKVYNVLVKQKAQSGRDGAPLMLEVWGCERGVLKITPCASQTDIDTQEGIKFLAAGLMQAIRNPTAHEPALHWPMSKQDCLDILSFVSFLFRQLDKAVYFKA